MLELGYHAPLVTGRGAGQGRLHQLQPRPAAVRGGRASRAARSATLREIYGVLHPAFLSFSGDIHAEYDDEDEVVELLPRRRHRVVPQNPPGMPPSGTLAKDWNLIEAGPIAMPESPEHLRMLIEEALVPMLGRRPLVDEDGDFVVPVAGALVFVRVVESAPVVAVFSQLVRGVDDRTAGRARGGRAQRRRSRWSSSSLVDDRIVAGCTLPANPFVGVAPARAPVARRPGRERLRGAALAGRRARAGVRRLSVSASMGDHDRPSLTLRPWVGDRATVPTHSVTELDRPDGSVTA